MRLIDGAVLIDEAEAGSWDINTQQDQTIKADAGKPKLSLVPTQIIRDIAEVREYGTKKYNGDPDGWRDVKLVRYIDALYRHVLAFVDDPFGEDEESGIPHYKHVACNMAFICEMLSDHWPDKPIARWERGDNDLKA